MSHDQLMDSHGALVALIEPPIPPEVPPTAQPVVVTTAPPYTVSINMTLLLGLICCELFNGTIFFSACCSSSGHVC